MKLIKDIARALIHTHFDSSQKKVIHTIKGSKNPLGLNKRLSETIQSHHHVTGYHNELWNYFSKLTGINDPVFSVVFNGHLNSKMAKFVQGPGERYDMIGRNSYKLLYTCFPEDTMTGKPSEMFYYYKPEIHLLMLSGELERFMQHHVDEIYSAMKDLGFSPQHLEMFNLIREQRPKSQPPTGKSLELPTQSDFGTSFQTLEERLSY